MNRPASGNVGASDAGPPIIMTHTTEFPLVDAVVVIIANAINFGLIAIFLVRARGMVQAERRIGLAQIALAVPLAAVVIYNAAHGRTWWTMVLPGLLVAFLLLELLLDYILKIDFRAMWLLGPYLLLFYTALMGMIGYAFLTAEWLGFITLATYFAQLGATAYSYRKVGHGAHSGYATIKRGSSPCYDHHEPKERKS